MKVLLTAVLTAGFLTVPVQALAAPDPLAVADQSAAMQRDLGLTERRGLQDRLAGQTSAAKLCCPRPNARRVPPRRVLVRRRPAPGASSWDSPTNGPRRRRPGDRCGDRRRPIAGGATLDRVKLSVDRLAGRAVPSAVSGWSADPRTGSVVVNVQSGRHGPTWMRSWPRFKAGPVTVRQVVAERPGTFAAGTVGGDPYYTGNVRCSIGFSVHGGYVTAGHCGGAGSFVRGWDGSDQGSFRGSSFPGQRLRLGRGRVRLVDGAGRDRLGPGPRFAGPRLLGGPTRYVGLPLGLDHALALRAGPGAQRDGELRQRRCRLRPDQDQRLCRGRRLRQVVHHR